MKTKSSDSPITWRAEKRKLSELKRWDKNPRRITAEGMKHLGASIGKFGLAEPLVCQPDGGLIGGHARLESLLASGMTEATCMVSSRQLTPGERDELGVRLNRNVAGEFDYDALANEFDMSQLMEWGFDEKDLLGAFDADEPADAEPQIDRAAELNKVWKVKAGDLFTVGEHRLLCGDSTKAEDVARVMGGEKAGAVLTDPPYGMNLCTDWSGIRKTGKSMGAAKKIRGKCYAPVIGDDKPYDPAEMLHLWAEGIDEVFLFGADYYVERIPNRGDGNWLVWDKRKESQSDGFGSEFELIWSRAKHKRRILRHEWFGFLREGEHGESRTHPTQKPVILIRDIIEQWCSVGIIADPYLGSGTTMVACQNLNRKCWGIEISPDYVAVCLQRMTDAFPGIKIEKVK